MKKNKIVGLFLLSMFLFAACGGSNDSAEPVDEEENIPENETNGETEEEQIMDPDAENKSDVVQNDLEIKELIEEEDSVSFANVIVTEDGDKIILVDIDVNESVEQTEAEALAEKYAEKIKEKYGDDELDLQVRQDGETIVHINK